MRHCPYLLLLIPIGQPLDYIVELLILGRAEAPRYLAYCKVKYNLWPAQVRLICIYACLQHVSTKKLEIDV